MSNISILFPVTGRKNRRPDITTVGPLAKALKVNYPALVANYFRFNPVTMWYPPATGILKKMLPLQIQA
jgi:hypothetical protein